ncbi:hypothetical protein [Dyella mobilis]|uniref:Uncharacterized protein n=1 Tax=Dyella mobilis TaxID=1849582 RepID=A0ABS2KLP3_9GAMM|nr:hypothetical protein [Dyella mobilis]MBM7131854.1 hypothetical protein [Dyella mobilis]GLQ96166.1 hypothetical protein GCM10007863_05840 [Dyella mobilis]
MTLGWTLLGTIVQMGLVPFLFMVVVFSASSIGNDGSLGKFHTGLLNLCIFALPAISALSALIVIFLHWHGGGAESYWWYAMPVVATVLYLVYAITLAHRTAK